MKAPENHGSRWAQMLGHFTGCRMCYKAYINTDPGAAASCVGRAKWCLSGR